MRRHAWLALVLAASCKRESSTSNEVPIAAAPSRSTSSAASPPPALSAPGVVIPDVKGPIGFDYLAYDPAEKRVWLPTSDAGLVAVLDASTQTFTKIEGFATAEREMRGKKRTMGPTAAAIGGGRAFIGNRGQNEVCAVDAKTLKRGTCTTLPSPIDGVAYAKNAQEVWVTAPKDHTIFVLDAASDSLPLRTKIDLDGQPEGYGEDTKTGIFYTNLEDKDRTLAIDEKTRAVKATFEPGCGRAGPRGLAVDAENGHVVVACTDHLQVLDAAHGGAKLGAIDTGGGVDNIDYVAAKHLVFAASGKTAKLTIATLDTKGNLTAYATADTANGARNVVAGEDGTAYMPDADGARLVIVPLPKAR